MKKLFSIALAVLLITGLAACASSGTSPASESPGSTAESTAPAAEQTATEEDKTIYVGCTGQSYPNSYMEDGQLVGFDVEVFELVATNLGYQVEWTTVDFSGAMGQLDSGKLDSVANAVSVTEEREEKYVFTDPYCYLGTQFVTHIDNEDINEIEDLFGREVSGVAGSNNLKAVEEVFPNGEITLKPYETRDGAQNDAINKRVDGYVNARSALAAEIAKGDLPLKMVGNPISYTAVAFPFDKATERGQKLADEFSIEINKLAEDGTLSTISIKYFNDDITTKEAE